ncbi:MAG: nucleotide sugar dehydrogenase [Bacteroidota bacterium]
MTYEQLLHKQKTIAVVGLGYVGLPLALEFAKKFRVIGFDINEERIQQMQAGSDPSQELPNSVFRDKDIRFTTNPDDLAEAHFYAVAVPTPVDSHKVPDLKHVLNASRLVGQYLKKGDCVVFESTVYPGCTEEDCLPVLEECSGLKLGEDFKIGYSPERISPGDKQRTIAQICKVVSGSDAEALDLVSQTYAAIITAGVYEAPNIRVAEAAKVIENTQRDLNISLVNELAIIFDKLNIDTQEVLKAAGTKWNFLRFHPGLVGGHCIGVDPYYLLYKAKQVGYDPQVILSGRRVNDFMPAYIAKKLVQMLIQVGKSPQQAKVLVMGITFKENVSDIRNSKVVDLVHELMDYSVNVHLIDPYASANEVARSYKFSLIDQVSNDYDAVVVAVNHREFYELDMDYFRSILSKEGPILIDIKAIYQRPEGDLLYWRL